MGRAPGLSARVKLTLSYAGFLMVAGVLLLAVVWVFLLRYVPASAVWTEQGFFPGRDDLVRAFAPAAAWALLALAAFGLLGGWVLAGRMLAPLAKITTATRAAASGSLSHRIDLAGPNDEFHELADSFDAMLAKLEAHVEEQRRFAANASHELRTPLAITQTMLDVARADPDADPGELIERLRTVNARAIELTQALLVLSRADRRSFTPEPVDLSLVAEEAAETLLPLAEANDVVVETSGDLAIVDGSPTLLLQLTTNLVHNAIVHNLAGGGSVDVATAVRGGRATLVVENTGDVLDPALVATLAEPFRRGTDRVRGDQAGVGLGLAIADSIVRAHDGRLDLAARDGGGLRVVVTVPAAIERPSGDAFSR
ncbi:sensor histidine kinase [Agromyces protaetiae]|uniref:sensor histidine kinase n=1 Tax=Agromyces protaetiae TaxID=2509455 RepID=UPI001AA0104D|nr:HAMP domain-containing sensor histidine kinase [Agromyces protaetiae]